ncbi:hypothetical protein Tco_1177445, partial [Tanacetum coccineum]
INMKREMTPSIEIDVFSYEAPICTEFAAFNHLLQIEEDMFKYEVEEGTSFEETMLKEKVIPKEKHISDHTEWVYELHTIRNSIDSIEFSEPYEINDQEKESEQETFVMRTMSHEEVQRSGTPNYQTDHMAYRDDDPYTVCRDISQNFTLNEQTFEQWDKVSEYEEGTNEELDNQDTFYAFRKQYHVEQSSSNECHKLDPLKATYYYKSDCPDEENMARHMQMDAKVNYDLE